MNSESQGKTICNDAYTYAVSPTVIPVPGNKSIKEYLGLKNTGHRQLSVARMVAPPGWAEPAQSPEFDEVTIVLSGKMQVEIAGEVIDIDAGQPFLAHKGHTIRYSNPFDEPAEYWAICAPAFSIHTANREDN